MDLRGRVREWEFVTVKLDPKIVVAIEQGWLSYYKFQHAIEVLQYSIY